MSEDATASPDRLQIGEFAEVVGLSIPQLRRYDRLRLLQPTARSSESGYRYYSRGQTGAARVIALLRSMDMPIADIRRVLSGPTDAERRAIFRDHRARLEARLDEVRSLLKAVDAMTKENDMNLNAHAEMSSWLHLMPQLPVTDLDRSVAYYEEKLGFRIAWRTGDGSLGRARQRRDRDAASRAVDWRCSPTDLSAYVYVDDPDSLCAEYEQAGADIVDSVASRSYGIRDFVVRDPDSHRFTIGRGEERLREVSAHYGLAPDEVSVNPAWLARRKPAS